MANLIKNHSRDSYSIRITLPKEEADAYIKKHGYEIDIETWGEGWKLSPAKKVKDEET